MAHPFDPRPLRHEDGGVPPQELPLPSSRLSHAAWGDVRRRIELWAAGGQAVELSVEGIRPDRLGRVVALVDRLGLSGSMGIYPADGRPFLATTAEELAGALDAGRVACVSALAIVGGAGLALHLLASPVTGRMELIFELDPSELLVRGAGDDAHRATFLAVADTALAGARRGRAQQLTLRGRRPEEPLPCEASALVLWRRAPTPAWPSASGGA